MSTLLRCMLVVWLCLFVGIAVVAAQSDADMTLTAEALATPTDPPSSPTANAATPPPLVPQGQFTGPIEELDERIDELERTSSNPWLTILEIFISWPGVVIVLILFFQRSLRRLMNRIAENIEEITIGELHLKVPVVKDIVIQREILRFGLEVALSDEDPSADELKELRQLAKQMEVEYFTRLDDEGKRRVLNAALQVIYADGVVQLGEYDKMLYYATQLNTTEEDLREIVLRAYNERSDLLLAPEVERRLGIGT